MAKTKIFNGGTFQSIQTWPINPYYGPTLISDLDSYKLLTGDDDFKFEITVVGYPLNKFKYEWFNAGSLVEENSRISITNSLSSSILNFINVTEDDAGSAFGLRITNPYNDGDKTPHVIYVSSTTCSLQLPTPTTDLKLHMDYAIDSRIESLSPTGTVEMYSTKTLPSTFVRNVDVWTDILDLTGIIVSSSVAGFSYGGVLISPKHFIYASHAGIGAGHTVKFVDNDNNVITRTITDNISYIDGSDIGISVLDSDLPSNYKFYKILPQNWTDYISPNFQQSYTIGTKTFYAKSADCNIAAISTNHEKKCLVGEARRVENNYVSSWYFHFDFSSSPSSKRYEFSEEITSGDSGHPSFFVINGEPILIGCWFHGSDPKNPSAKMGDGPTIHGYKDSINTVMTTLGGGYQLTEVDLSSFYKYF